jgi:hypothetical protein
MSSPVAQRSENDRAPSSLLESRACVRSDKSPGSTSTRKFSAQGMPDALDEQHIMTITT